MTKDLNQALSELMTIDGVQAVALVDYGSGMLLGSAGSGIDMDLAAAGNTEVLRAKMRAGAALDANDTIEDILITMAKAYHVLRPVAAELGLFFYVVLNRQNANLALARHKVREVEQALRM